MCKDAKTREGKQEKETAYEDKEEWESVCAKLCIHSKREHA